MSFMMRRVDSCHNLEPQLLLIHNWPSGLIKYEINLRSQDQTFAANFTIETIAMVIELI